MSVIFLAALKPKLPSLADSGSSSCDIDIFVSMLGLLELVFKEVSDNGLTGDRGTVSSIDETFGKQRLDLHSTPLIDFFSIKAMPLIYFRALFMDFCSFSSLLLSKKEKLILVEFSGELFFLQAVVAVISRSSLELCLSLRLDTLILSSSISSSFLSSISLVDRFKWQTCCSIDFASKKTLSCH